MTPTERAILDLSRRAKAAEARARELEDALRTAIDELDARDIDLIRRLEDVLHRPDAPHCKGSEHEPKTSLLGRYAGQPYADLPDVAPCTCPPGWRGSSQYCPQHFPGRDVT